MTGAQGDHLVCSDLEDYVVGRQARDDNPESAEENPVSDYGMTVTTSLSMGDAEAEIRSALTDEGFGVLTEIDVAATLKAKLDVDRAAYKILGACNPQLANQALQHDEAIGLLLPCNVTLSDTGAGTVVSAVDPKVMLGIAGESPEMMQLASEARAKLQRAIDTLPAPA